MNRKVMYNNQALKYGSIKGRRAGVEGPIVESFCWMCLYEGQKGYLYPTSIGTGYFNAYFRIFISFNLSGCVKKFSVVSLGQVTLCRRRVTEKW
jgi:hypothetical protein